MKRRTPALTVSVPAAALLVAAPLLTGCSTESRPGAAAVVGGEPIPVSDVQARVEATRDAQRAQPNADQLIGASGPMMKQQVSFLVTLEIVEAAAEDAGVAVTRADVQRERATAEQSVGSAEDLERVFLLPEQTPPVSADQIDDVLRGNLMYRGLAEQLGSNEEVGRVLAETSDELGVEVNPRYGEWDPQRGLVGAEMPWLRAEAQDMAPAALDG